MGGSTRLLTIVLATMVAGSTLAPASAPAAPTVASSFDTGLDALTGLGLDPVSGNLFVHEENAAIHEFTTSGSQVAPTIPAPGVASNDFDLDFTLKPITIGGTSVPTNSLLAVNGDHNPDTIYALNKNSGAVLASVVIPSGISPVGIAHHPDRNSLFVVDWSADDINEIDPNTGSVLATFSLSPSGAPDNFDVFYGDVDVTPSGNLLVAGSAENKLRELTPTGQFVADHEYGNLEIAGYLASLAIEGGQTWVGTTTGHVFQLAIEAAPEPVAVWDWSMVPRFGFDKTGKDGKGGPDGLIDYPTPAQIAPNRPSPNAAPEFEVIFDACQSGFTTYEWLVEGTKVSMDPVPGSSCKFSYFLPEGTFDITLRGGTGSGTGTSTTDVTREVIVQDWLVVGLGDSYGSGEGAPEIPLTPSDHQPLVTAFKDLFKTGEHLKNALDDVTTQTPIYQEAKRRYDAVKLLLDNWKAACPGIDCAAATQAFLEGFFTEGFDVNIVTLTQKARDAVVNFHAKWDALKKCSGSGCAGAAWDVAVATVTVVAEFAAAGWAVVETAFTNALTGFINAANSTLEYYKGLPAQWKKELKDKGEVVEGELHALKNKVGWQSQQCHRSANSGQARAARQLEQADPKTSVTFVHVACSGAQIAEGILRAYEGIEPGADKKLSSGMQIEEAKALVQEREIDALVFSIGGNDANFANIVKACILMEPCYQEQPPPAANVGDALADLACKPLAYVFSEFGVANFPDLCKFVVGSGKNQAFDYAISGLLFEDEANPWELKNAADLAEDGLEGGGPNPKREGLKALYKKMNDTLKSNLLTAYDENGQPIQLGSDRVFITEYPDATHDDNLAYCGTKIDEKEIPGVSTPEYQWVDTSMVPRMNGHVATAANLHGWNFVTGIVAGTANHGYCANDTFLNRFHDSFLLQAGYEGAVHPNIWGFALQGQRIFETMKFELYTNGDLTKPRPPITQKLPNVHTLAVLPAGTGKGSVTSDPAGINCGSDCDHRYKSGKQVDLVATAGPRSKFAGFTFFAGKHSVGKQCVGLAAVGTSSNTCPLTMTGDLSVSAEFAATAHRVSIEVVGSGDVTSTPSGMKCKPPDTRGRICTGDFKPGTQVTLRANPDRNARFKEWALPCGSDPKCSLTANSDQHLQVTFEPTRRLEVSKSGSGSGTVTDDAGKLFCGTQCDADYDLGATVQLTATPDAGSRFDGWRGDCADGTCVMRDDLEAAARFIRTFDLFVGKEGDGQGRVTSSVTGIDCGSDCKETYDQGTAVVLQATPEPGYQFMGWDGACSGTGSCTVTMNATQGVLARFETATAPRFQRQLTF